ncbi:MAG: TPM domain-containing protein [Anaerobutyricum soehngenii]
MAKTYRRILIFIVILGVLMGLLGKKFAGDQYVNTEPRKNTECTLTKRVFDDADVLTDEEEKNLEALIAEKEELIGGDLVLITTNDASLDTMEKLRDYAQNYYKENKLGWDQPIGSGAIYVDDWETRYIWLATRGIVKDRLSKDNTDYIVDETNDIVNKDPYKAYTRLINLIAEETQKSPMFHINISPIWVAAWLSCGIPRFRSVRSFRIPVGKRYSQRSLPM